MDARKAMVKQRIGETISPLLDEHGGDAAVSRTTGVNKSTVGRWRKGEISLDGLARLASALRQDITLTFPAHGHPDITKEAAAPEWARRLTDDLRMEIRLNRAVISAALEGVDPEEVERILARLETLLGPPVRWLGADPEALGGATSEPRPEATRP